MKIIKKKLGFTQALTSFAAAEYALAASAAAAVAGRSLRSTCPSICNPHTRHPLPVSDPPNHRSKPNRTKPREIRGMAGGRASEEKKNRGGRRHSRGRIRAASSRRPASSLLVAIGGGRRRGAGPWIRRRIWGGSERDGEEEETPPREWERERERERERRSISWWEGRRKAWIRLCARFLFSALFCRKAPQLNAHLLLV